MSDTLMTTAMTTAGAATASDLPDVTTKPETATEKVVTCFSIRAAADPGTMSRVMEVFARRGLVPQRWHADMMGTSSAPELAIDMQVGGLSRETGAYLARCLRQIWGVDTVLTAEKGFA